MDLPDFLFFERRRPGVFSSHSSLQSAVIGGSPRVRMGLTYVDAGLELRLFAAGDRRIS